MIYKCGQTGNERYINSLSLQNTGNVLMESLYTLKEPGKRPSGEIESVDYCHSEVIKSEQITGSPSECLLVSVRKLLLCTSRHMMTPQIIASSAKIEESVHKKERLQSLYLLHVMSSCHHRRDPTLRGESLSLFSSLTE